MTHCLNLTYRDGCLISKYVFCLHESHIGEIFKMAIPLDKEGNDRRQKLSKSKYRLDDSERKLPRPIVFWSENEKDAFRRNKVVQTRYYMLLDDIEIQQRSSEKSIRHEAHKIRQRYKTDIVYPNDNGSCTGLSDVTNTSENVPNKSENKGKLHGSDSMTDQETWADVPKRCVITKIRQSNVKFSVSDEFIPDAYANGIEQVKKSTDISTQHKGLKVRSQSASQGRSMKYISDSNDCRSKSAMLKVHGIPYSDEDQISSHKTIKSQRNALNKNTKYERQVRKPNSIFFDRSQAAYQLRKELQRQAKKRQHGVVKVAYTMEDALREERDKLSESSKKVAEYLQKLEIDQRNMKINEWTTKTIEPVLT